MNNSIETTWKNAFIDENALIAPKVNNLYDQKSIHIISDLKKMFRSNLNAITFGAVLQLLVLFYLGIPVTGIIIFFTLALILYFGWAEMKNIDGISTSESSYSYLKKFDSMMKSRIAHYKKLYQFVYPTFLLSFPIGLWFSSNRESVLTDMAVVFPESELISGVPLPILLFLISSTILLALFGGALYTFELKLVYGKVLSKFESLLIDMEELKK